MLYFGEPNNNLQWPSGSGAQLSLQASQVQNTLDGSKADSQSNEHRKFIAAYLTKQTMFPIL